MGQTTDFMVAIELGSTRITGVAGQKDSDGKLTILAYASEDATACIRKGAVFNIDKTAGAITSIINKLEAALDASIAKVYVGISGQSVRTVKNTVIRQFEEETRITNNIVDELISTSRSTRTDGYEILEVVPQEYKVGTGLQTDPVGVITSHIEGRFLHIIARQGVRNKIEESFQLAATRIAGYFIAPLEMAKVTATDTELRAGCALIDFGAETTTVQVYKDYLLRHLVVLPLGSNNITKDICSLGIEETVAEDLKVKYASAYSEPFEADSKPVTYTYGTDDSTITDRVLNEITEARMEEIIANVWNQIGLSGYDDKLMAGIIVTGGGSHLGQLQTAIQKKTHIEKFRHATYVIPQVESVTSELLSKNSRQGTLLGLLNSARQNCCEQEPPRDLFDTAEKETEAARIAQQEEIERQKAEAARRAQEEEAERAAEAQRIAQEKAEQEAAIRREEEERQEAIRKAKAEEEKRRKRENSLLGRLQKWATEILNEEE
ncbi:MAG: cell division protein FtsA [Bacteroidaceae bacterium]|nr:cell division protein FtsA [Bacteroidaceae bacterium]